MQTQTSCSRPLQAPCYGKYYTYSSGPAPAHADRPRKPKPIVQKKSGSCFANHATNIRTRGAHEFYNMMWDPSVYRGNTTKPFSNPEMERCNQKRRDMDSVKRRKYPRKPKLIGGIVRPSLSLAELNGKVGLGDMGMQTDPFLQEMTSEVLKKDMSTQIEAELNNKREESGHVLRPFMIGVSQDCQTETCITHPFEENVRPVQRQLCHKILEQSLLETTEEMELESLRIEKRKYIQLRSEEMFKLRRAIEAQRAVAEDRIKAINASEMETKVEMEAESRLGAALFSAGCMGGMLPITFGVLKLEGYMSESGSSDIYENLLPWMNEAVRKSYEGRSIVSRKLLDDMLQNVTSHRETEFALNQFPNTQTSPNESNNSQTFSLTEDEQQEDSYSFPILGKGNTKSMIFSTRYDDEFGEQ